MSVPIRIQLKRTKGWRIKDASPNGLPIVKVCRPSKYGNPFEVCDVLDAYDGDAKAAKADVVRSFRQWICEGAQAGYDAPPSLAEIRSELGGKNLACWCKESPCHADVLLELAISIESKS